MPYDNIPTENAAPLRARAVGDYEFRIDLSRADIDDLGLFDSAAGTSNRELIAFLDKVVSNVRYVPEQCDLGAGVSGKGVPLPALWGLMRRLNESMKELQNAGN